MTERLRRHLRVHGSRALLSGISTSAVVAGFLDATGHSGRLLQYIGLAAGVAAITLLALAMPAWRLRQLTQPPLPRAADPAGRPRQLEMIAAASGAPVRQMAASRCDDPVYGAGLRALLAPGRPLVVIPSNRRDVGRVHELPLPLFGRGEHRTRVDVDPRLFGVPMAPYSFERELPEGVQDTDHTLAVKDLVFVPELVALLRGPDPMADAPVMWPEHCVDLAQLAERDVVVVGGPDTNFWHGALFEPVARQFAAPPSSVPLALDLREGPVELPSYGSRSMSVVLAGLSSVLRHTREDRAELDERLYPTYGMILACRNPFAAAIGRSHWCAFVAGTRSLGTSGAVLGLAMMLQAMGRDPELNFFSEVPTESPDVRARVSAVLCRTVGVEQAVLRRDGALTDRGRRQLASQGLDELYSDSYVPQEIEYLSYAEGEPRWATLGRLS
ncbi:MAG TPA: hypothetical protein VHN80_14640 [Kineosporiaceae bacterium]|nr:hypothetical protein [Kineosporiaceae bacterium]